MAKTLLGIIGSPRKFGNSEVFVKEIYRQLPSGWELKLVRLPDLDIRPCRACYQCLFGEKSCPQTDDFSMVLEALADSDAYAVAAPAYLLGANASLKRFLDRGLSFYAHIERLWGKPAVAIAIAGIEGMEGRTKLDVESFVKLTLGELKGAAVIYGALPGEVFLQESNRAEAKRLAEALMAKDLNQDESVPVCNACGGDTFRFLPDGKLRCMLCSSVGSYEMGRNRLEVRTVPGEHPLFLTKEHAIQHAEWLRGMKDKFLLHRKELKAVTQGYTSTGSWIQSKKNGV